MELLTRAVEQDFKNAGWFPGRSVAVGSYVLNTHPANRVLEAFGGLKVGQTGVGEECACDNIEFGVPPSDDEDIRSWQTLLKTEFVGLGKIHNGHGQLWLDHAERLFSSGLVAPMVLFVADGFAEGVERLLRGRRSRPMLLPWQEKVMVWGEWFHAGDPRVLTLDDFNDR